MLASPAWHAIQNFLWVFQISAEFWFQLSFLLLHFFTPALSLFQFTKTRRWSAIIQSTHSHWSSALFRCFLPAALCAVRGSQGGRTLTICQKECTTAGMKEEVTKVLESSERKLQGNGSFQWVMKSGGDQPLALITHALKSIKYTAFGVCCLMYSSSCLRWRT